jgi:hypothetical protein
VWATSSLAVIDRLVAASLGMCFETAPILVLVPVLAIYVGCLARGTVISGRLIYILSFLCFVGQMSWLAMMLGRIE